MDNNLIQLQERIAKLENDFNKLRANATIPIEVDAAFRARLKDLYTFPTGFEDAPLALIDAPTGGAVEDVEARAAINTIITRLEDLGLIEAN